ncbi:MAG: deoxyribose-phosphate aldolase [Bacteroidales bacterium]|nr:deoxyribose-phosphate aldolase [Bacteroidales bacterium]MBR5028720.1 deoxyribose-phosphate aldolase [Bacteroidales bacterium]
MIDYSEISFPLNETQIENEINSIISNELSAEQRTATLRQILHSIDNTTLEGSDTDERVIELCNKSKRFCNPEKNILPVAAVCVYPTFVSLVKEQLKGTGINTASVAGAFPSGQSPLHIKLAEIDYAIEQGADEIDMVISRGAFLQGDYDQVFDEIAAIRELCCDVHLKVILETGELQTPDNIYRASKMAIDAGADFIKTSTGKISVGATYQAAYVMLTAIAENLRDTHKMVGFKAAGGVSTVEHALAYAQLFKKIVGEKYFSNQWFRIGTSRLTEKIFNEIL